MYTDTLKTHELTKWANQRTNEWLFSKVPTDRPKYKCIYILMKKFIPARIGATEAVVIQRKLQNILFQQQQQKQQQQQRQRRQATTSPKTSA